MSDATLTNARVRARPSVGTVVIGSLAAFGITVSGAVLALITAGLLQWNVQLNDLIDDGLPLVVLGAGMLIAGRVAVDVAGTRGILSAVGAASLTAAVGSMIVKTTSAHGDAIEPLQVFYATVIVLLFVGGSAWTVGRRRQLAAARHEIG